MRQSLAWISTWPKKQACGRLIDLSQNQICQPRLPLWWIKKSAMTRQITFPLGNAFRSSDLDKNGMGMLLDPKNKPTATFLDLNFPNSRWRPSVKGPKSTIFDPTNYISARHLDPVHLIWTKFGMGILLDLRHKMATGGQKLIFDKIYAQKSHFSLANGSLSSDLDKIWQANTTQP